MISKLNYFLFLGLCVLSIGKSFKYEDISSEIFPVSEDTGIIAAYGHFNNDEFTDVVTLQQGGNKLQLLKGSENRPYFEPSLNCTFGNGEVVTSVVPADFNGDSLLDILITLWSDSSKTKINDIRVLWGTGFDSVDCKSESLFYLNAQPFIADFNGDMIPDIIGETLDGKRYVWISSHEKKFTNRSLSQIGGKTISNPHSSGLIDLNNDMTPDILMRTKEDIEIWLNTGHDFIPNGTIQYPEKAVYKWQSTFMDINMDGKLNHLLPICYDRECRKSAIMMWKANDSQWVTLLDNFRNPKENVTYGFRLPMSTSHLERSALPTTLRYGDVNMDGYPDLLVVLQSSINSAHVKAVILRNIPCESCTFGRSLEIIWDVPGLSNMKNIQLASFFDLFEDGILDILVSTNNDGQWKIQAFRNTEIYDSCFLKVLVLSGLCYNDCSTEPYGVNQPGPLVRYNMTKQDGTPVVSTAIQLPQSAHFPLQLPYSMFGLGPTPNFIDVLTVSIPAKFNGSVHSREWLQIIPNSQIVVIPYPPNDSSKWVKKLFVTPSRLVMLTCISLVGTCIFIALIVALLHWKEKREDKRERMQEAYRFNFDAM
ncbi:T-cell immunomodulatory protein [Parasteatoda tepidariorum]|uniref:T-cell immunomodulatory protein n=1 Tax=Parasteatoda tepidariorum TaxID=114398 RepID=UPI001C724352|nr:T-cell immunomodulatory protein [Parasteatoda tepidariorum]